MRAFSGAIFPRTTSACGAYMPASAPAGQPPGAGRGAIPLPPIQEKLLCRIPGKPRNPALALLPRSAHPPAPDQGAAPQRGNSGNKRPVQHLPKHIARDSPAAGSHSLYRSWRTILSPAYGSPFFPCRVSSGSCFTPCLGLELFPVAEHAADPVPVGAAVTAGAFRRQAGRTPLK